MKRMRLACCLGFALMLMHAAWADTKPARLGLKLPPAALGTSVSLQQRLQVEREGRFDQLDAMLEIDDEHVGLVGLVLGLRVLSFDYDGKTFTSWRHAFLPEQVKAEDVLEDIQLTYWPAESIRAALPEGWTIEDQGKRRILSLDDKEVMVIDYSAQPRWAGKIILSNLRYQYRLTIQSVATNP